MISPRYLGALLILLSACGYATVALFGKYIFAHDLPLTSVLSWRFGGAALLIWLIVKLQKQVVIPKRQKLYCFLLGLTGDVIQTFLFFLAVEEVGASIAAVLFYTFPFFVFLIQRLLFRQIATKKQWTALAISILGIIIIVNPFQNIAPAHWSGLLYGLGSAITYSFYLSLSAHWTKDIPAIASSLRLTIGAFIGFTLLALYQGNLSFPSTPIEWEVYLCMILIATVIPFLSLIKGMQLLGPTQTSLLFTIEPVITIGLAILLFSESLAPLQIFGCLLTLGSVLWIQSAKKIPESEKVTTKG